MRGKRLGAVQKYAIVGAILAASATGGLLAGAQVMSGVAGSFITLSMAGLGGAATTVAGDARLPVLPSNVTYDPSLGANAVLRFRANSLRHTVRQLEIEVRAPRAGQRYDFGAQPGSTMRVRLDTNASLVGRDGRGHVMITAISPTHASGTYEGTFESGAIPIVLRGRFEVAIGAPAPAR